MEARGERIALDVGLPLDAPSDEDSDERLLPAVPGFRERDHSLLGRPLAVDGLLALGKGCDAV